MKLEKRQFKTEVGGKTLTIEVSSIAERSNAAVLAKYGETVVLVTVVMSPADSPVHYMPLRVDYEERFYAAGKIIGSRFIRREGRPSDDAVLTGRLVDRTLRPLFDQRLRREVQVVVTVLAYDEEYDPDFVGLMGASCALALSDVPWKGPVGGVRIAKVGGEFLVNPPNSQFQKPELVFETFVAGAGDRINMIEFAGKEAKEEEAREAFARAKQEIARLVEFQEEIKKEIGKPKANVNLAIPHEALKEKVVGFLSGRIEDTLYRPALEYYSAITALKDELLAYLAAEDPAVDTKAAEFVFDGEVDRVVHENILEREKRPDGRRLEEVRPLVMEVGLFRRTHGSAFFARGNTQALAVVTLAPPGAEQLVETMELTGKRRFMLHYNFPPYSVGEIGPFRAPGRREIGHGALAEKALRPLIPDMLGFPYTIRVVSETLSSNGSSSMATVSAGALALMDAGVPMRKPCAGIAIGLMSDDAGNYKILTDIQGPEDHHGDMDFKVAGTEDGITAIQMDVKMEGLTMEMLADALRAGRDARRAILTLMQEVLPAPRPALSPLVPAIVTIKINPEKIGEVIGSGGKVINALIRRSGVVSIDIEEDGTVYIAADDPKKAEAARDEIVGMTKEFTVGEVVEGRVVKILDFGAIVDVGGGRDGMIHVSELKNGYVKTVSEVVKMGDLVRAKVIRVEPDGKIGLSLKQM